MKPAYRAAGLATLQYLGAVALWGLAGLASWLIGNKPPNLHVLVGILIGLSFASTFETMVRFVTRRKQDAPVRGPGWPSR